MRFGFTDEQLDLRNGLRSALARECPPAVVRAAWEPGNDTIRPLWKSLGAMGLLGLLAPQSAGGMGADEIEMVLLLEECGRVALPGPIGEHVGVGTPSLAEADADLRDRAVEGDLVVTAAEHPGVRVKWAPTADIVLSIGNGGVTMVDLAGAPPPAEQISVDRSVTSARVDDANWTPLATADATAGRRRATLAAAAQLLGLADALIEMSADYAKVRTQFGVPIGSQQAVKHALAGVQVAIDHARPVVYRAGWVLATAGPDPDLAVSFAKVYATRAAESAARTALQCHGAIGYSWEHDLHLWIKRVWALSSSWGTTQEHEARIADLVLGPVAV